MAGCRARRPLVGPQWLQFDAYAICDLQFLAYICCLWKSQAKCRFHILHQRIFDIIHAHKTAKTIIRCTKYIISINCQYLKWERYGRSDYVNPTAR